MHGDGLRELLCDGILPVFKRFIVFNLVFDLIVTLHFQFAIFVGEAVCAGQLEDIFKNCALVRAVLVGKVQRDARKASAKSICLVGTDGGSP